MRSLFIVIVAAGTLIGLVNSTAQAGEAETGAKRFVETLSSSMIAVLGAAEIDADEQAQRLRGLLDANVDLERIGRYILGKHWDEATPDQRREYQLLFANYALSLFSQRLVKERLEQIAVVGSDNIARSQALVHTRIQRDRGKTMQWIWRVRRANDGFQAIDLIMNGVSLVKTYRSQIGSLVSNLGIDGLLTMLRIKSI